MNLSELELSMHILRMMRTGRYQRIKDLLVHLKEDIPDLTDDQIEQALKSIKRSLSLCA